MSSWGSADVPRAELDATPQASATNQGAGSARGQSAHADEAVQYGLRVAAAYAWRLVVIGIAVFLVLFVTAKLTLAAVAVFVGLVICALLRPFVDLCARVLPRSLSVASALLLTLIVFGAVFTFIANSVAGQSATLSAQFADGLADLERSLTGAPFHLRAVDLTQLSQQARAWVTHDVGSLAGQALSGAGVALEVLTGFVLAVFCSIFFLSSGDQLWTWLLAQTGGDRRRWDGAARAGWATSAGYTRGIVRLAPTNASLHRPRPLGAPRKAVGRPDMPRARTASALGRPPVRPPAWKRSSRRLSAGKSNATATKLTIALPASGPAKSL